MKAFTEIANDFEFLEDWEDRYRYLIELGGDLPAYPDGERRPEHKVSGCASQVWLESAHGPGPDPVVTFRGQSDAHIVRGLVALALALFSGRRASDILAVDAEGALRLLGLDEHLSSQRANGLRAMVRRIRQDAEAALSQSPGRAQPAPESLGR